MRISLDAARGLAMLHGAPDGAIIFRDLKASNVLLDAVCQLYMPCLLSHLFAVTTTVQYCTVLYLMSNSALVLLRIVLSLLLWCSSGALLVHLWCAR